MKEQKFVIDVDVVIASYNKNNPELRKLDRNTLAEKLHVNKQILSDWKRGKTPKLIYKLLKLMEIGNVTFEELLKRVE